MLRADAYRRQAKLQHQLGDWTTSKATLAKASNTLKGYQPALASDASLMADIVSGIAKLDKLLNSEAPKSLP
jgi:hypothetical protein